MSKLSLSKLSKHRLDRLLNLAQQLLAAEPQAGPGGPWLEPFQGVLGISAICLFDGSTGRTSKIGGVSSEVEELTRTTYMAGMEQDDPAAGIVIRPLVSGSRIVGAAAFQGLEDSEATAGPVMAILAAQVERARLRRQATDAAVAAGIEAFRTAIFDALRSECINALTTILTAAGGIREAGPLRAEQLEMARIVEEEASRLGSVLSRLDRMARLDQGEVTPRMDTTNVTALVAQAVDEGLRVWPGRNITFASRASVFKVLGDDELIRLVLTQLIDHAVQHAAPGSAIVAQIEAHEDRVEVRVSGKGAAIPSHQHHNMFERAYIGAPASNFASGSGLGLYVARKIAVAHGGTLDFGPEPFGTGGFAFRLALPRASDEPDEGP